MHCYRRSGVLNLGDTYCSTKGACQNAGGSVTSVPQDAFKALSGRRNPNRMINPESLAATTSDLALHKIKCNLHPPLSKRQ